MSDHLYDTSIPVCMTEQFKSIPSSHEWEQPPKAKKFHRAFAKYKLLLCDLDASSFYTNASRHVPPPKSGEDAHMTCGIMGDLGGPTLNQPRLGFSYILPKDYGILWELALHLMSLGCFPTNLEHSLPLDTHMQHICITSSL